jgi:ABC-type transporter MlaC component
VLGLTIALFLVPFAAWADAPPKRGSSGEDAQVVELVRRLLDTVRSYETAPTGRKLGAAQRQRNAKLTSVANGLFDVRGLASRSLGKTWDKLSAKERESFVGLLSELFGGVAYPKAAEFFRGLKVEIKKVHPQSKGSGDGRRMVVETSVSHPNEGLVQIHFHLTRIDGSMKVVDVVLDGVSLALDIRGQMQKILREESYEELKKRMKDKLDEA